MQENNWQEKAACKGIPDPDIFFSESAKKMSAALAFCSKCPVMNECGQWALSHPAETEFGIYGGMTEGQRKNRE